MREISITIDETSFNVFWRSLCDREEKLLAIIHSHDEASDIAVVGNNDIIYLRAVKESFEKQGREAGFGDNAFETSDEILDLSNL
jgi:hypothetical protein